MANISTTSFNLPSLDKAAVTSLLRIGAWSACKKAPHLATESAMRHNADTDAIDASVRLLPKNALTPVQAAAAELRKAHNRYSLPWIAASVRLLPLANVDKHRGVVNEAMAAYGKAVDDFIVYYRSCMDEQRRRLGDLFDPYAYPEPDRVRRKLAATVSLQPLALPDGLSDLIPDSDDLTRQAEAAVQDALRNALQDGLTHIREVTDRLRAYAAGEKKRLHTSVVEAASSLGHYATSLATIAPADIAGELRSLAATLSGFEGLTADEVKATDRAKAHVQDVAARASEVIADIDAALGI